MGKTWKLLPNNGSPTKVEYKGATFWAWLHDSYGLRNLFISKNKMKIRNDWGYPSPSNADAQYPTTWAQDSNSCAYKRLQPYITGHKDAAIWLEWYLEDMDFGRAVVCYVTKHDGDLKKLLPLLVRCGFNKVAVNKSTHEDHYPVYMLVNPGKSGRYKLDVPNNNKKSDNADESQSLAEME